MGFPSPLVATKVSPGEISSRCPSACGEFPLPRWCSPALAAPANVCYQCPNLECEELFISYFYRSDTDVLTFRRSLPFIPEPSIFTDAIKDISSSFCEIYDEAQKAEQFGLTQVCGVGYRKALEFLIKDYSIRNNSAEKSVIEASFLGKCINVYVTDPKVKQVAERAVWLGNDETHYQRRWIGKDLHDLKVMIRLVLHWIEAEHLTAEALNSMPPP
jgi:hypothetical protein